MARRIESLFIAGPAGRLESLLEMPEGEVRQLALVCHPHPLHGGNLHNKVVHRLARALRAQGAVTLRFNFRGVNLSEGSYDHGIGEVDDARAAAACLLERFPGLPWSAAGFSFGSRVALQMGAPSRRVIMAGFPSLTTDWQLLTRCPVERIFIHSTNDAFGPKEHLEPIYARLWGPKQMHWIESADHFFSDRLDRFEETVRSLRQL